MHNNNKIRPTNWLIDQLNLFQAANSDAATIRKNFIVRKEEFETIIDSIKRKTGNDSIQHELILGRRGSGKSTLLRRIEIEIAEDKNLSKKFVPINLPEEQAGIYRLFDLWELVLHELQYQFKQEIDLKNYDEFKSNIDYTKYLYNEIHNLCEKHKRKVVLLLDNIDRIIENFTDDGHLLRETLINYSDIQIVGGSTRMDEHFWRYDMPFYEFFRIHRLESLSTEEMKTLLLHWSDSLEIPELKTFIENNSGKLENIRILTDGLPRTLQFFIQMVLQKSELNSYDYLKKIMDNASPLFQERLNSLTGLLKKTVLELAFFWEACTTKELSEKARMESKLVSASLRTLSSKGIVDKIETDTKNHLYRLSERFFNLWIIITQGNPEQKRKVKWLSIFLENFYGREDLKRIAKEHLEKLKGNKIPYAYAAFISEGLAQSKYLSNSERDQLIEWTKKLEPKDSKDNVVFLPKKSEEILKKIEEDITSQNYDNAIKKLNEIENGEDRTKFLMLGYIYDLKGEFKLAEKCYLESVENGSSIACYNLALLYFKQNKFELAEKYYLKAIEFGNNDALYNLGSLYHIQKEFELAEKYYLRAFEKGSEEVFFNLALLYENLEKFDLSENFYLKAVKNEDIEALFNLAHLYSNQGNLKLAEKYYLKASEKGINKALFNLALLYYNQEKFELAEKYYLKAFEKGDNDALNNLALLYYNQEKFELAENFYLKAIDKGDKEAINNLALLYFNQEKFELAEKYYLKAIERGNYDATNNLALLYYSQEKFELAENFYLMAIEKGDYEVLFNLAILYHTQEKFELAEKYYLKAIGKGSNESLYNICSLYYQQNKNKKKVLDLLKESNQTLDLIIVEVWNGIFNDLENRIMDAFKKVDFIDLDDFITEMLVHRQKSLIHKLFTNDKIGKTLQDKYMVLYYVVLILNQKEVENLKLKIPPELKSTTKEILERIRKREIFYGYKEI